MKYADRAQHVIDEIGQLPSTRQSLTDPARMTALVNLFIAEAKYDWAAIDSKLFPDGKPLDLDLSDPALALSWKGIRQRQRDIVEHAIRTEYKPTPRPKDYFTYDKDGFSFTLSLERLANEDPPLVDPKAAADILVKYFPGFFELRNGRLKMGTPYDPYLGVDTATTGVQFAQSELRRHVLDQLTSGIPADVTLDGLTPARIVAGCRNVIAAKLDDRVQSALREHRRYHHRFAAQPSAKSHVGLEQFLQSRLDKARLRLDAATALDQFNALPILGQRAKNAKTARTWGIELEIIDAAAIAFDAAGGWKRERDGSLRQQIGDGRIYDPWEFISPVLDTTYSDGLWMICDQAKNTVKYYKAGVHIHVSAVTRTRKVYDPVTRRTVTEWGRAMTTAEVSRLIELYATMSPLLDPIIQRTKTREFCVPTKVDQWAKGWFEAPTSKRPHRVRPLRDRKLDAIENAKLWAQITKGPNHDAEPTEWKRHQELNLQSLNKYGTIEFRSMGAVYDYEYLTRWAWLCRAMVDYAQSTEPIRDIYSVTDFNSLVTLLSRATREPIVKQRARRAA